MISALDSFSEQQRIEERRLLLMIVVSLGAHFLAASFLALWRLMMPGEPLVRLEEAIQVDMVSEAMAAPSTGRKKSGLPDRETFVPVSRPEVAPSDPTVPRTQEPKKPEDAPRDATSIADALKGNAATPDPGLDEEARLRMNQILARTRTASLLEKYTGVEGSRNRFADEPDGGEAGGAGASKIGSDPGWATALNQVLEEVWVVQPTYSGRDILVRISVRVDAEGTVTGTAIERSSGDIGFDQAAVRAVKKAGILPLPTRPEVRAAILMDGFVLGFNPKGLAK